MKKTDIQVGECKVEKNISSEKKVGFEKVPSSAFTPPKDINDGIKQLNGEGTPTEKMYLITWLLEHDKDASEVLTKDHLETILQKYKELKPDEKPMPSEMKALFRKHDELLKELDPAQIQSIFNSSIRVTTDEAEQSVLTFIPDLKNNLSEWMNPSKVRKAEGESTLSATFDSLPDGETVSQKTKVEWFVRTLQLPADVRQTHSTNGPLKGVASGLIQGHKIKSDYKHAIESFLYELIVETDVEESKELKEGEVLTPDHVIHTLIDRYGVELVEILEYLKGEDVSLKDTEDNTIYIKRCFDKKI